jgi:hypothetical protein
VNCRYHAANRRAILDSRVESTRLLNRIGVSLKSPPASDSSFETAMPLTIEAYFS